MEGDYDLVMEVAIARVGMVRTLVDTGACITMIREWKYSAECALMSPSGHTEF